MSDPTTAPQLTDSYVAYRDQATDQAAYQQEQARVAQSQAAAPVKGGSQPSGMSAEDKASAGQIAPVNQPKWPQYEARPTGEQLADNTGSMIEAEVERLSSPPFQKSRYANPEEALRQKAMQNLGVADKAPESVPQKAEDVAKDVGYGTTVELPRAVYTGAHAAIRSVLKMADDVDSWSTSKLADWHMDALNGAFGSDMKWHAGADVESMEKAGTAKEFSSADALPFRVGDPQSTTGTVIKNVSQFMTGMAFAGGQLRTLGLPTNMAGWAGRGVSAAQGFLAQFEAFDGAQHRLSDLVQSVPSLRNPVTQFLASNPDDTEVEGRLKNALEGTAIGQAADGVLSGIKMLRGAIAARSEAQSVVQASAERPPPPPSAGMHALGFDWQMSKALNDEEAAAAKPPPVVNLDTERWGTSEQTKMQTAEASVDNAGASAQEVAGMREPAEKPALMINFSRIDTADDIKNAMQNLADKFSDDINTARRGVRTFQDTQLGAQAEDAWKVLMNRRVGQPLNDSQSLAARQLWASSASKTVELADIATKAPTLENLYAFRKMLVTHAAIQEQVIAARTETARALSSWRIPAGEDALRLEGMVQQLSSDAGLKGGAETAKILADKVNALATSGDWSDLSSFVEKSALAKTRDAVLEGWTNALLTAPMTHVKVTLSNMATTAMRIAERGVAAKISSVLGDTDGVAVGEASAQTAGLIGGFKDAFRFAGKLLTQSKLVPNEGGGLLDQGHFETPTLEDDPLSNSIKAGQSGQYTPMAGNATSEYAQNSGAISSEAFGLSDSGWMGKGVDLLGQITRSPGRALTAEHDFFRSIGYRMELNAQAVRMATADVNAGRITQEAMGDRVAQIIADPPPQVNLNSVNGALYQTFTDAPGKFTEMIGEMRNEYPLLRVILPFYKIPSRIMSFTFERSPLAPLMSTFRQNFAAGGARQSLAVAQMGLGSAAMMATADAVLSGHITGSGPKDQGVRSAMENEGWQPYSIKVGDKWMQYNRVETAGSSMAMAADAVEAMRDFQSQVNGDDPDVANLGLATVASVANDITSKSYLQGLSSFFEAIADPASNGRKVLDSLAGSTVPAGVAAIDRVTDPYKRQVYQMIDAIRSRTPGLSEDLPPQRNLWGEPVKNGSGEGAAFDLLSPVGTKRAANEPIDRELIKQGIDLSRVPSRTAFDGVTLDLNRIDPKIYSRFQELAGNAYKGPDGLGLKDALNALVTGQHPYSPVYDRSGPNGDGPDGPKADMIRDIMTEYREGAKQQLLTEFPQLGTMVKAGQQAKMQLKTGTLQ